MAYFDDEDDDRLADLADDAPGSLGEMRERDRIREELARRRGMPSTEAPEPEEAPEPMAPPPEPTPEDDAAREAFADYDLSALDNLEDETGAALAPAMPAAPAETPEPYDRNPDTDDTDMGEWSRTPNDPEPDFAAYEALGEAPPDDPEAMAAFDEEPGDAPVTLGTMMDHNPAETTADALDDSPGGMDEAYPEEPAGPVTLDPTALLRPADPMATFAAPAAEPPGMPEPEPDDMGGLPDMDRDDLMDEEEAFAGPTPEAPPMEGAAGLDSPWEERSSELEPDHEADAEAMAAKVPSGTTGPPEADFTGADWSDALRRPLHALGAGLLAASGRGGGTPFRSERDALQARLTARDTAKGAATDAFTESTAERGRWDADRASREGIASERTDVMREREGRMAEEGAARSERDRLRLGLAERAQGTRDAEATSRISDRTSRVTEREEGSDPATETSARARSRLPAMVAGLPPELAETIRPELEAMGENLSADDVAALERMPATAWRAWLTRRRGLGGGSPGGGTGLDGTIGTLAEALRARGDEITDEEAAAAGAPTLRARLQRVLGSTGEAEIIDGVYGDAALIGSPTSVERRNLRQSVIRARRASGALATLSEIHDEWGAAGALPETAEASAAAALRTLMAYSTQLGETGIISPGEVESIRAELPNPAALRAMAPGAFARRIEAWRSSINSSVEDDLEARGVSADSMDRALGWIATGSFDGGAEASGGSSGGTVRVRDPETGEVREATEEQAAQLEAAGYEVVR